MGNMLETDDFSKFNLSYYSDEQNSGGSPREIVSEALECSKNFCADFENEKYASLLQKIDKQNIKGVQIIKADVSNTEGEYIRHNPELIAKQIVEIIVNDMKFKDKKGDEKFILLNSKLK